MQRIRKPKRKRTKMRPKRRKRDEIKTQKAKTKKNKAHNERSQVLPSTKCPWRLRVTCLWKVSCSKTIVPTGGNVFVFFILVLEAGVDCSVSVEAVCWSDLLAGGYFVFLSLKDPCWNRLRRSRLVCRATCDGFRRFGFLRRVVVVRFFLCRLAGGYFVFFVYKEHSSKPWRPERSDLGGKVAFLTRAGQGKPSKAASKRDRTCCIFVASICRAWVAQSAKTKS